MSLSSSIQRIRLTPFKNREVSSRARPPTVTWSESRQATHVSIRFQDSGSDSRRSAGRFFQSMTRTKDPTDVATNRESPLISIRSGEWADRETSPTRSREIIEVFVVTSNRETMFSKGITRIFSADATMPGTTRVFRERKERFTTSQRCPVNLATRPYSEMAYSPPSALVTP